jgi:DNA-binding transcriptional LysR family regulator
LSVSLSGGCSVAAGGAEPTRLLGEFARRCPEVEVRLRSYELTQPSAGLLDHGSDVAFVRPPVAADQVTLRVIGVEPRVFVLPSDHPLATQDRIGLGAVVGEPWIAAELATDGCRPAAWRDEWLVNPRPSGERPIIGALAATIDEWREHVVAGRGISLCPASAETHYARPGLRFVASTELRPAELCLAWRTDDPSPIVRRFVEVITEATQRCAQTLSATHRAAEH